MKSRRAASNVCVCCPASVWHRRLRGVEVVGALRGPARGEGCTRHRAPAIGSFALPRRPPLPRSPPLTDHIPQRRRRATPSSPPPLSLSLSFVVPGMTPAAALLPHTSRSLNTHLSHTHPHPTQGCSAAPASDENMFIWNASIIGPDESPWEGGIYALRITFPDQYVTSRRRVEEGGGGAVGGEGACVW